MLYICCHRVITLKLANYRVNHDEALSGLHDKLDGTGAAFVYCFAETMPYYCWSWVK